jgi:hypothetical protein
MTITLDVVKIPDFGLEGAHVQASLRAISNDAGSLAPGVDMLRQLGVGLPVKRGPRPALIAVIDCPRGRVELRSYK